MVCDKLYFTPICESVYTCSLVHKEPFYTIFFFPFLLNICIIESKILHTFLLWSWSSWFLPWKAAKRNSNDVLSRKSICLGNKDIWIGYIFLMHNILFFLSSPLSLFSHEIPWNNSKNPQTESHRKRPCFGQEESWRCQEGFRTKRTLSFFSNINTTLEQIEQRKTTVGKL